MKITFAQKFANHYKNYTKADRDKINEFVYHVTLYGLNNLTGRNKSSDGFSNDDPDFLQKMERVKEYNLWHYHIGIPSYEQASNGDMVSEYVLHYIRGEDHIIIVDLDSHPPFNLPNDEYLQ